MSINEKNLTRHELIGLDVEVSSSNKSINGLKGKITDETKNTFTINQKIILKNQATFKFTINKKTIEVSGTSLIAKPEDRIKR